MKIRLMILLVIVLAIVGAVLYLRFGGVTHERIVEVVDDRAEEIKAHIDIRYSELNQKLDRVESKLDRLLEIATRPFPDGMQPAGE
mgnify:FL=1